MVPFRLRWRFKMGLKFGADFMRARQTWLYEAKGGQSLLAAFLLLIGLFLVLSIMQAVFAYAAFAVFFGDWQELVVAGPAGASLFTKSAIIGLMPASIATAYICWRASYWWNPSKQNGLALHVPALGILGWFLVIVGFALAVYGIYFLTFTGLGIDPKDYTPTSGGLEDTASMAGMIEKVLADLADEPLLFAMAVPGIAIFVPIAEELIFRGAIFSALVNSWFGRSGAVLITSAMWAVIHGATAPWLFVGIIFLMGIVLGILLLRFGSLWVTIVCHCVWNALTTLSIFGGVGSP
jgi:uncharacterized protein